jgi:hypothetical protein
MSIQFRRRLIGRASFLGLAVAALALAAGGFMLSQRAEAQGRIARHVITFPAAIIGPERGDSNGIIAVLIGLLLPAVQKGGSPFVIEAVMGDGSVSIQRIDPRGGQQFFDVFLTPNEDEKTMMLHLRNRATGEDATSPTTGGGVVIRLLPAVQGNGNVMMPLSMGQTLSGFDTVKMGDGSVRLPFHMFIGGPSESN